MKKELILNSWKEISTYLGRGIRTVQRWEASFGMPVHRPAEKERSAVVAFASELNAWLISRKAPVSSKSKSTFLEIQDKCAERIRHVHDQAKLLQRRTGELMLRYSQIDRQLKRSISLRDQLNRRQRPDRTSAIENEELMSSKVS